MSLSLLHISHPNRPLYEEDWFGRAAGNGLVTVVPEGQASALIGHTVHLPVHYARLGRLLGSTASPVRYGNLEAVYQDQIEAPVPDIIVTLELFSTTTQQGLRESQRIGCSLAVLVYELIKTHPIYHIPPFHRIAREVARSAQKFICVTERAADHLLAREVSMSAIEVVNPGVDTDLFVPPLGACARDGLIFVGRLAAHKGLPEALLAFERLYIDHSDLRLTIIGDGPMREAVVALAATSPNISYLGVLSKAEVASELRHHAIFLAPSKDTYRFGFRIGAEQFAFGVIEAMASGLAVVASDCGALPEVLPDCNPIIRQNDPEALRTAIEGLLMRPDELHAIQCYNREAAATRFAVKLQAAKLAEALITGK